MSGVERGEDFGIFLTCDGVAGDKADWNDVEQRDYYPDDDAQAQRDALQAVQSGMLADMPEGQEREAAWVVTRTAEVCGWEPPAAPGTA